MALRKTGVTFQICFRKRGYPENGGGWGEWGFPQKKGVLTLEETMTLSSCCSCFFSDLVKRKDVLYLVIPSKYICSWLYQLARCCLKYCLKEDFCPKVVTVCCVVAYVKPLI